MSISKRSRAARRGWAQRTTKNHPRLIDHIVTVTVKSPGRGGKGTGRTTTRDLIIPARPGTRKAELLYLADKYVEKMPKKERYAVGFLDVPGRKITVAEGPKTRGRKVKLR